MSECKPERILKDAEINNISQMHYSLQHHTVSSGGEEMMGWVCVWEG
jgi:hypothetical protein